MKKILSFFLLPLSFLFLTSCNSILGDATSEYCSYQSYFSYDTQTEAYLTPLAAAFPTGNYSNTFCMVWVTDIQNSYKKYNLW